MKKPHALFGNRGDQRVNIQNVPFNERGQVIQGQERHRDKKNQKSDRIKEPGLAPLDQSGLPEQMVRINSHDKGINRNNPGPEQLFRRIVNTSGDQARQPQQHERQNCQTNIPGFDPKIGT